MEHTSIPAGEIHQPYQWVVANEAARLAITPEAGDENKLCLQQDTGAEWRLATVSPIEWVLATVWEGISGKPASFTPSAHNHTGVYDPAGTASTAVANHEAASDPHPQYQTQAEGDARYSQTGHNHTGVYDLAGAASSAAGSAVAAHELASDPHPQYQNQTRGDARYSQLGHNHTGVYDPAGTAAAARTAHEAATGVHSIAAVTGLQAALDGKIPTTEKGAAGGVATLDSGGKVPASQLPATLMEYQGTWNASTNTPTLADGTGSCGNVYRVTVAGTINLGSGSITFDVGDYTVHNGSVWEKSDTTDSVPTVFGRTGNVTAQAGDYTAGQVTFVPAGNIAATNVQAAIAELDTEKQPVSSILSAIAGVTFTADKLLYATGTGAFATTDLTAFGRSLIDDADAATARNTLGLGSMATQASSAVSITGGSISLPTLTLTQATGIAPMTVSSATLVTNLNANFLQGGTWASPGNIGTGTAGSGAFTTLSATGAIALAATPSAWNGAQKVLQFGSIGHVRSDTATSGIGSNCYYNASNQWVYQTTAAASMFLQNGGAFYWQNAASGTAGTTFSPTTIMTLDASSLTIAGATATKASGTTWANPSDIRVKDIKDRYMYGLDKLMKLEFWTGEYNGKGGTPKGTKFVSVKAQDVQKFLPDTVSTYRAKLNPDDSEETEILKWDSSEVMPILVNSVQNHESRIADLESENNALKATLKAVLERLTTLESA